MTVLAYRRGWDRSHTGYIYHRFRGASPACPRPMLGDRPCFISVHFVSCMRASGQSEAMRAHVRRYPARWGSRVEVSTCLRVLVEQ